MQKTLKKYLKISRLNYSCVVPNFKMMHAKFKIRLSFFVIVLKHLKLEYFYLKIKLNVN